MRWVGALLGAVFGLLAGTAFAYWMAAYGAKLLDPGYRADYNYAAAYWLLAGALGGAVIGAIFGLLVVRADRPK